VTRRRRETESESVGGGGGGGKKIENEETTAVCIGCEGAHKEGGDKGSHSPTPARHGFQWSSTPPVDVPAMTCLPTKAKRSGRLRESSARIFPLTQLSLTPTIPSGLPPPLRQIPRPSHGTKRKREKEREREGKKKYEPQAGSSTASPLSKTASRSFGTYFLSATTWKTCSLNHSSVLSPRSPHTPIKLSNSQAPGEKGGKMEEEGWERRRKRKRT
jgi:hypothetical protein